MALPQKEEKIEVVSILVHHFLSPDVGAEGAVKMTLVRSCVHPTVLPKSCNSYIFCPINLKFCRLFSNDMKKGVFFIFVLTII